MKRTHLCVLARTRPIAKEVGLTPARFDMLRLIALYDEWGLPQWKLVRLLGVSAAVVSRMLKQLTELGLVRRRRDDRDRRRKIVNLEPDGVACVEELIVRHVYDADLECIAFETFSPPDGWRLHDLYRRLNRARIKLHDRAPFLHPWRVADLVDDQYRWRTLQVDDIDDAIPREAELARLRGDEPSVDDLASVADWTPAHAAPTTPRDAWMPLM